LRIPCAVKCVVSAEHIALCLPLLRADGKARLEATSSRRGSKRRPCIVMA